MKFIEKNPEGRFVFVGDTHGDLNASESVFEKYSNSDTALVFLGDYVDRGPKSRENADFLLDRKRENPDGVYLLQGNHENYMVMDFSPADFWLNFTKRDDAIFYARAFEEMPLVFSVGDIVALHGALPNISCFEDVLKISDTDSNWVATLWGDFHEGRGLSGYGSRPSYGREYFDSIMGRLGKNVLIRGHDYTANRRMFDNRCLTLFTCSLYGERTVAVADFRKNPVIRSIDDLTIDVV